MKTGGFYRKNISDKLYVVVSTPTSAVTHENFVVYRPVGHELLYVRPAKEFSEKFHQPVPRGGKFVDIVFDGPPDDEAGRFVEVENEEGSSVKLGEWVHREDGFWVLRIPNVELGR